MAELSDVQMDQRTIVVTALRAVGLFLDFAVRGRWSAPLPGTHQPGVCTQVGARTWSLGEPNALRPRSDGPSIQPAVPAPR